LSCKSELNTQIAVQPELELPEIRFARFRQIVLWQLSDLSVTAERGNLLHQEGFIDNSG
jgi:hypothetical protein